MRRIYTVLAIIASTLMFCAPAQALEVVVVGDSFAAGEGGDNKPGFIPEPYKYYLPGQLTTCKRTVSAAGYRLANELKADSLKFVACGGAKVDNVLNTGQHGEPAQVTAISTSTDVLPITIGGNDLGFSPLLQRGFTGTLAASSPEVTAANVALSTTLPASLDALFADIKSRIGSQTKVLVTGYPYLPPKTGAIGPLCAAYLTASERDVVINLEDRLNLALKDAVSRTADPRFTFVDPTATASPFLVKDAILTLPLFGYNATFGSWGRDACNLSPYNGFNTIRLGVGNQNNITTTGAFHPNIWGHYYYLRQLRPYVGL